MYARRLKGRNQRWSLMFQSTKQLLRPPLPENISSQTFRCFSVGKRRHLQVLRSMQPLIVYFPDSSHWLSRAVPTSKHRDFMLKLQDMFEKLLGHVALICGQNKSETGSREEKKITMILPNIGRLTKLASDEVSILKLYSNILCINPPKDEDLLRTFRKQVQGDRKISISRSNLNELHQGFTAETLNLDDFKQSKSKVAPSVAYDAASMNELRKWNEQYGEGGSRRKSAFGF